MNARLLLVVCFCPLSAAILTAQNSPAPERPVPVSPAPASSPNQVLLTPPAGENQRVYGPTQSALITPAAAQDLSNRFREAYGQNTSPRVVIYVNRAIGEPHSDLKVTGRTERHHQTSGGDQGGASTAKAEHSAETTYAADDTPKPTLADQQTTREIERLFGRVFRNAGARLADARAAAALLPENADVRLSGDNAAREREALRQVADIAIEVLVSSQNLTVSSVSGDNAYTIPDIQVAAVRLSDAAIIGQAASSDVLGHSQQTGQIARRFGVPDITEATAFALMEDMLTGVK